jgi:hypothetical protein
VVKTIINNKNNTTRISIRKALIYSGYSKNMYYGKKNHRYAIATAGTIATAVTAVVTPSTTTMIEQEIQKISM